MMDRGGSTAGSDTVVAERRPRKTDTIRPSPAPVPERHRSGAADWLGMVEAKMLTQHNFTHDEEKALKRTYARENWKRNAHA